MTHGFSVLVSSSSTVARLERWRVPEASGADMAGVTGLSGERSSRMRWWGVYEVNSCWRGEMECKAYCLTVGSCEPLSLRMTRYCALCHVYTRRRFPRHPDCGWTLSLLHCGHPLQTVWSDSRDPWSSYA